MEEKCTSNMPYMFQKHGEGAFLLDSEVYGEKETGWWSRGKNTSFGNLNKIRLKLCGLGQNKLLVPQVLHE